MADGQIYYTSQCNNSKLHWSRVFSFWW
jgi:hypothetical protein